MEEIKVFLDTDIIISSLISDKGASYELVTKTKVEKSISKTVEEEVKEVSLRENIDQEKAKGLLRRTKRIMINLPKEKVVKDYLKYVFDEEDSHVVAGAHKSRAKFLLTYNIKHYDSIKIKNDLGIIVMKPGTFLQHLRSH